MYKQITIVLLPWCALSFLAVAADGRSDTVPAAAGPQTIINDRVWTDTSVNPIRAQGGSILNVGRTYYLFTSGCEYWNSTATAYRTSTDLKTWSPLKWLTTDPPSKDSYNTQTDFILVVKGSKTTSYLYCGDRYSQFTNKGVGLNAWFPLTFDSQGEPTLHGLTEWVIDVATGEWRAQ